MSKSNVFEFLYAKAKDAVANNPGIEQIIVLQTAGGKAHVILNDGIISGNHDGEEKVLKILEQSGDTHVLNVVALWNNYSPDLPSFHFRSRLVELDERNMNTLLFMGDVTGYHGRTIRSTL